MRVLVTTPSAWGHLQPMVPLAKALVARGHELRWATGADSCDWIAAAGVVPFAAGVTQQATAGLPPEGDRRPAAAAARGHPRRRVRPSSSGGTAAPAMLRDLLPLVAEVDPRPGRQRCRGVRGSDHRRDDRRPQRDQVIWHAAAGKAGVGRQRAGCRSLAVGRPRAATLRRLLRPPVPRYVPSRIAAGAARPHSAPAVAPPGVVRPRRR